MLRIATRGSALALWQADRVAARLGTEVEIVIVDTQGDRDKRSPLHSIGGKGVFVKEVQAAVLDGRADLAVHSAKDLPAETPDRLTIAAIPERGNPLDALVGGRLAELATGARIGTGSVRRRAQLVALRPDLTFGELRGNIATRLDKAAEFDAIVVAAAALERLAIEPHVVDVVSADDMVPQVGQGALAIECRADDVAARQALAAIDDPKAARLVMAERAFLRELGGDCSLPAAAHAVEIAAGEIELSAFLAADDLSRSERIVIRGADGPAIGTAAARSLRAAIAP